MWIELGLVLDVRKAKEHMLVLLDVRTKILEAWIVNMRKRKNDSGESGRVFVFNVLSFSSNIKPCRLGDAT